MQRLFIVEDDYDILDLITMLFEGDYEIDSEQSIRRVLDNPSKLIESHLIITDFLTEDLTCKELIEHFPEKTFLIISAYSQNTPDIKKLLNRPNVYYLQKPFDIMSIKKTVKELI
ncbi:MAG: hypothetical protein SVK54_09290 [candidate division WOR-3 bacterium]|nr:hypothetical protein [candidate division WOR-3 bacterium]